LLEVLAELFIQLPKN